MKEIRLVITERKEFVSRDEWMVVTQFFGNFGLSEFWSKQHEKKFSNQILLHRYELFDSDLDGKKWNL